MGPVVVATAFPKLRGDSEHSSRTQDNIAATLTPLATALAATPIMGARLPAWIRPDLLNGFADYGSPFAIVGFHKDALGYVHCKGVMIHAAGCAAATVIMIFPLGYRPLETQRFSVPGAAVTVQEITVDAAGNASPNAAIAAGAACDFSFIFLAEQ